MMRQVFRSVNARVWVGGRQVDDTAGLRLSPYLRCPRESGCEQQGPKQADLPLFNFLIQQKKCQEFDKKSTRNPQLLFTLSHHKHGMDCASYTRVARQTVRSLSPCALSDDGVAATCISNFCRLKSPKYQINSSTIVDSSPYSILYHHNSKYPTRCSNNGPACYTRMRESENVFVPLSFVTYASAFTALYLCCTTSTQPRFVSSLRNSFNGREGSNRTILVKPCYAFT